MPKAVSKRKSNAGAPSLYSEPLVRQLEDVLKVGGTVSQACAYAGITRDTYYRWLNNKDEFSDRMSKASAFLTVTSKQLVNRAIVQDDDLQTAKWWLEKTELRDTRQTNVQVNISDVLKEEREEFDLNE